MDWLAYFSSNRVQRFYIPWEYGIHVEEHLKMPMIRSLQRFQVGESGDGVHIISGAQATGDKEYAASVSLFIQEEQEHARLLAKIILAMGGTLLDKHWSDTCFILIRRLFGLREEIMVLMMAEMIAQRYYRALEEGTDDEVLTIVFRQISHDEVGHVGFHVDTLHRTFAGLPRIARCLIRLAWQCVFRGACLLVAWDHRSVLRAVGVSPWMFIRDCDQIFRDIATRIFQRIALPIIKPAFEAKG